MSEPIKFTVWRDRWLRGNDEGDSCLLKGGHRCCLGFFGQALGIDDDEMEFEPCPSDVPSDRWPSWLLQGAPYSGAARDSDIGNRLMKLNDDSCPDVERERKLVAMFAEHGVEVTFRDGDGS